MIEDPFVLILTEFLGKLNNSNVVLLSLRCLDFFPLNELTLSTFLYQKDGSVYFDATERF